MGSGSVPGQTRPVRARLTGLHVLTDARGGRSALEAVTAAAATGAQVVQVRAKDCSDRAFYEFARQVVEACAPYGTLCLINDRVDIALAVGADGTHLGANDLPIQAARLVAGAEHVLGGTARDPVRAAELVAMGADYLGVGPAYPTTTKTGLPDPLGPAGIAAVAAAVAVPVIAIGGVTGVRIPELLAAGAAGIAVVSAVTAAADPAKATRELLQILDGGR